MTLALAVFSVSVFLSFSKIRQSHEAALEASGVSLWLAFQADYEAQRLVHALDVYALGDGVVGRDDLLARLDIFWSRLPLLIQGSDSVSIKRATAAEAQVPAWLEQLARLEPALRALTPGDAIGYAKLRHQLVDLQKPLRQLSLEVDQTLGQNQSRLQQQMSALYSGHVVYLVGIIGSAGVFICLLIFEASRTRRLLAATGRAQARAAHLAQHDSLTDLPNRMLFQDRLQQALARAARNQRRLAVHCLDLDRFKDVNDRYGHAAGDALLVAAARRMLPCLRRSDTLARLGGDEFAVVQVDPDDAHGASQLTTRLMQAFEAPLSVGARTMPVSISLGVALFPDDGRDMAQLLRNADAAMYQAKSEGRGTARFYSSELGAQAEARHRLERDLRDAVRSGGFELHYQPKYRVEGLQIVGMEALLRWNRPGHGFLPPSEFVPVAEECGLIAPIGDWVLRTACQQNRAWQDAGLPALCVAVNLSAVQFAHQDLVAAVGAALHDSRLDARHLELEITESALLHDTARTLQVLNALRRSGIHLSLDDFGTGYSSLNYLLRFKFDSLKLDRGFVRNLGVRRAGDPVCRALLALARNLDMTVVAEGVETADQLARLELMGCDQVQGYFLGAPEPARAFERRLSALMAA